MVLRARLKTETGENHLPSPPPPAPAIRRGRRATAIRTVGRSVAELPVAVVNSRRRELFILSSRLDGGLERSRVRETRAECIRNPRRNEVPRGERGRGRRGGRGRSFGPLKSILGSPAEFEEFAAGTLAQLTPPANGYQFRGLMVVGGRGGGERTKPRIISRQDCFPLVPSPSHCGFHAPRKISRIETELSNWKDSLEFININVPQDAFHFAFHFERERRTLRPHLCVPLCVRI